MKKSTRWLIALLTFTLIALFCALGAWQLKRAHFKEQLEVRYQQRQHIAPIQSMGNHDMDLLFRRGHLAGRWLKGLWILLDNKIHHKKLGYEVYALFKPHAYNGWLLVNLGFTPLLKNRHTTPVLPELPSTQTVIDGFFSEPPRYFALGNMTDKNMHQQPLVVQYINVKELEQKLQRGKINKTVFILDSSEGRLLELCWVPQTRSPEKNRGYALQWFAMAFTLLLLFLTLFFKRSST